MQGHVTVVTPPDAEPVSVADLKAEMGISGNDYDDKLERLIKAARLLAEMYTGRAFAEYTLRLVLDGFPPRNRSDVWWDGVRQGAISELNVCDPIVLPRPPFTSVTSFKYYDIDSEEQTLTSSQYQVDSLVEPARVFPGVGQAWPSNVRAWSAVAIEYEAGYPAADVPAPVLQAIISHASAAFRRPDLQVESESIDNASVSYRASVMGDGNMLLGGALDLLRPYRLNRLGF